MLRGLTYVPTQISRDREGVHHHRVHYGSGRRRGANKRGSYAPSAADARMCFAAVIFMHSWRAASFRSLWLSRGVLWRPGSPSLLVSPLVEPQEPSWEKRGTPSYFALSRILPTLRTCAPSSRTR